MGDLGPSRLISPNPVVQLHTQHATKRQLQENRQMSNQWDLVLVPFFLFFAPDRRTGFDQKPLEIAKIFELWQIYLQLFYKMFFVMNLHSIHTFIMIAKHVHT